ncbi:Nucleolar protein 13 [Coemansia brasiliensis]|uniref:Nucleolar protein 13 n=1 Tax=Coemansia brasiliensis TaxID=2650707 RepID=A0A9W8IBF2_9FUNG|nr:Nucleolar protein 13 [Coemansia brasiliensis]
MAESKEQTTAKQATKASLDPGSTQPASSENTEARKKRSEYGVWIGNLPYSVTKEDLSEFFKPCNGTITRINLPKKNGKSRGFAYVDFDSEAPLNIALSLSESRLNGRSVLIKDAKDFNKTGMPSRATTNAEPTGSKAKRSANPPSPSLFVGNLSYDVKRADLKAVFKPFGELVGIRVATFEDNPQKCKGFAYIDFKYTDDATRAMKSPQVRQIGGRKTRIEYAGEDATRKGRPWEFDPVTKNSYNSLRASGKRNENGPDSSDEQPSKRVRKLNTENMAETKLQGLPVAFEGQKITFGD